ncbi:hypothetical protein D9M68_100020 [compost metagenome]
MTNVSVSFSRELGRNSANLACCLEVPGTPSRRLRLWAGITIWLTVESGHYLDGWKSLHDFTEPTFRLVTQKDVDGSGERLADFAGRPTPCAHA